MSESRKTGNGKRETGNGNGSIPHSPFPALSWGFYAFVFLLPLHALLITALFGAAGWPAATVRVIAAWKELLIALLFVGALATRRIGAVVWLDLVVLGLGVLAFGYLLGGNAWFGSSVPMKAGLYGLRDTAFVSLLYFVGRATPGIVRHPRALHALVAVGVITSVVAILERIFVTPEMLVLLGASRYVQDFLGAAAVTTGNPYGLPHNYWTEIGGHLVQRAGSTYLSAQAFAIAFLIIIPAATLWVTAASASARRGLIRWALYSLLWIGLLLTVTRVSVVICALQAATIFVIRARWRPLVSFGLAGAVAAASALVVVPGLADFLWRTALWQTASNVGHMSDWVSGIENFARRPLGAGLGSTDFVAMRFGLGALTADNQYLRYAVELGLLGLLLHVGVLAGALTNGVRVWRGAERPANDYGLLLVIFACGIAVNAMTAVVFNAMIVSYVFYWLTGAVTTAAQRCVTIPHSPLPAVT